MDNSYKAIDEDAYSTEEYDYRSHDLINIEKSIISCPHAALITEIKLASPFGGSLHTNNSNNNINRVNINDNVKLSEIASIMVGSGAIGISVLTQPYLFKGSIEHLATIRKTVAVPLLMKDITVSEIQIDAAKRIGADCVLLIKTIFDQNLTEGSIEKFAEYASKKGLQVIVEVHSEQEFGDVLKLQCQGLIGINNRNLSDLKVDILTTEKLLKKYNKRSNIIISESGISRPEEIQFLKRSGADAFLIGSSIMKSNDIGSKVSELYMSLL